MIPVKQKRIEGKVLVAMSGGVDSSVAAALLKKAKPKDFRKIFGRPTPKGFRGFDVIGVFMKFWSPESGKKENCCCSSESEKRARKVAKILDIPFYVFNFEKEFKKRIVDYFLKEYESGRTPNPCVVCNKEIKFGLLLEKALDLGADYIATGHYARIRKFVNSKQIRYSLMAAKDKNKDQSYFLWKLNQEQLKHILFPVGNYTRVEVEQMAKKFKLPFSNVKKSMEVCFVPNANLSAFLKSRIKANKGKIVDAKGRELGRHAGIQFYTIGQRKGIKLAGGPYYVANKNAKKNLLIVTKNGKDLYKKEISVKNVNWVAGNSPKLPLKAKVKIRYRSKSVMAMISKNPKPAVYNLKFARSQRAITPGQSAVLYQGKKILGGGIIS